MAHSQDISVSAEDAGRRLDQFLAAKLEEVSRARVQQLMTDNKVEVNGHPAKASVRWREGDRVAVLGPVELPPLRAQAENIPLELVYEGAVLAVINKPPGMMVHAGA